MHACFTGDFIYTQSSAKMSEFWQRKIATLFDHLDLDKDGVISKSDFELLAKTFCAAEKTDPLKQEELEKRWADVSEFNYRTFICYMHVY